MTAVEAAEDSFTALLAGDATGLGELIGADVTIVDVITGAVADRAAFLGAIRRGVVSFGRVELVDRFTRLHGAPRPTPPSLALDHPAVTITNTPPVLAGQTAVESKGTSGGL